MPLLIMSVWACRALPSLASAAIENSRWGCVQNGWKEPPILWGMIVGNPSAGKSPALDCVLDPMKELEREYNTTYCEAKKEWDAKSEIAALVCRKWRADMQTALASGETPPEKPKDADAGPSPIRDRISVTDVTTEKLADILSQTWRGLLLSRDELAGWLTSMDRYNSGGDRQFWLEAYGGRSYTIDRKNNPEPVSVDHLYVAIIGGTQPDKLIELLVNCSDDGLLARMMVVFPEPEPIKQPTAVLDEVKITEAIRALRSLSPANDEAGNKRPLLVHFTGEAKDKLFEFRKQC